MAENNIPEALLPTEALQPEVAAPAPQAQSPYTVNLLQNDNDVVLPIEQDDADIAIRSGLYSPNKNEAFKVVDTAGDRFTIQGSELRKALNEGFRLETSQERHEREVQEKYGDQEIQTGLESAASMATFGLSRVAQRAMGVKPEDMAGREEANPTSAFVGDTVGLVGGLLTGSAEAQALKAVGKPIVTAAKLSTAVEKKVAQKILKEGAEAGIGKKIAASLASKAVGGAVEGTFYSTGALIDEAALGKADVNAENLVTSVGMGAIIGGAFGAAIGTAELALPLVKRGGSQITDYVKGFTDRDKAALEITGYTPAKAVKLKQKNPDMASGLADFLQKDVGMQVGDDAVTLEQKIASVKSTSGRAVGDIVEKVDEALEVNPALKVNGKELFQDLAVELEKKFLGGMNPISPEYRTLRKEVEAYYSEIIKSAHEGGHLKLKDLHELRQGADTKGYVNNKPVETTEGEMARLARRFYDQRLKNAMDVAATAANQPQALANFKQANRLYNYSAEVLPKVMQKAAKAETLDPLLTTVIGGVGGALTGDGDGTSIGIGAAIGLGARSFLKSDLRKNLIVLGKIEKAQQKVASMSERAVKGFIAPTAKAAVRTIPMSIINSEFAKRYEDGKYKKPKDVSEAYQNMHDNFARYAENPEAFTERVNRTTASVYGSAPNTSVALDALAVKAAMFLGEKLPKRASHPGMTDLFKKQRPPSSLDLSKFERYLTAVEKPEAVFEDMEKGRLSQESVEALKTVYPNMYEMLREKTLELVGKSPNMPYNRKLQLGVLLDVATDESLLPENVLALQSTFAPKEEEANQGAVNSSVSGMKELNVAGREETETERIAERV